MREFRNILNEVVDVISGIALPIKVGVGFNSALMDVPLRIPTIGVGIKELTLDTDAVGFYAGTVGGKEQFSVPYSLKISANITLPDTFNGFVCYDVLSEMCDALLNSNLAVYRVSTGEMYHDRNFLSVCLPVTIHLHDRALNEE